MNLTMQRVCVHMSASLLLYITVLFCCNPLNASPTSPRQALYSWIKFGFGPHPKYTETPRSPIAPETGLEQDISISNEKETDQKHETRFRRQTKPYMCRNGNIDAIVRAVNGKIYMVTGQTVSTLNSETLAPASTPDVTQNVADVFPGITTDIDGAVSYKGSWSNFKTYVFAGNKYYRFSAGSNGNLVADSGYPKNISVGWGFNEAHFDAVFTYRNTNTLIFIKGTQWWHHTGLKDGAYPGYPKPIADSDEFKHLGNPIKAAFLHHIDTNYFVTEAGVTKMSFSFGSDSANITNHCSF